MEHMLEVVVVVLVVVVMVLRKAENTSQQAWWFLCLGQRSQLIPQPVLALSPEGGGLFRWPEIPLTNSHQPAWSLPGAIRGGKAVTTGTGTDYRYNFKTLKRNIDISMLTFFCLSLLYTRFLKIQTLKTKYIILS